MIEAAGAVVWRPGADDVEIVLVHRPRYDDWSLPKGKLHKGEPPILGALREVAEETGADAILGPFLGKARYRVGSKPKRVRYWAMRCTGEDFLPGAEVDRREWMSPGAARGRLSHAADGGVLDQFMATPRPTWPLAIVLPGAVASPAADGEVPDPHRRQAEALVALLGAFGVERAVSADSVRCRATLAPAVARHRLQLQLEPLLGEDRDRHASTARLLEIASAGIPTVLCADPDVATALLRSLADRTAGCSLREPSVPEGGLVVVHLATRPGDAPAVVGIERLDLLGDRRPRTSRPRA